eukprot:1727092-Pyramimonas_sp.AAC.1
MTQSVCYGSSRRHEIYRGGPTGALHRSQMEWGQVGPAEGQSEKKDKAVTKEGRTKQKPTHAAKRKSVPQEECLVSLAQRLPTFDENSIPQTGDEGAALWERNEVALRAIQTANLSVDEWFTLIKSTSETTGQAAAMFNAVLHSYAQQKDKWTDALDLLDDMSDFGCEPDVVSFSAAAVACHRAGEHREANLVLEDAAKLQSQQKGKLGQKARRSVKRRQKQDVEVIYEDDDVIAVNKPVGMLVHPGPGASSGDKNTLCDGLLWHCGEANLSTINGFYARGIVHRLDRGTSGIILAAKNNITHALLLDQWQERDVGKEYLTLVEGVPENPEGVCTSPVEGRPACSKWKLLETFRDEGSVLMSIAQACSYAVRRRRTRLLDMCCFRLKASMWW